MDVVKSFTKSWYQNEYIYMLYILEIYMRLLSGYINNHLIDPAENNLDMRQDNANHMLLIGVRS